MECLIPASHSSASCSECGVSDRHLIVFAAADDKTIIRLCGHCLGRAMAKLRLSYRNPVIPK
jgi:hypothetical protein